MLMVGQRQSASVEGYRRSDGHIEGISRHRIRDIQLSWPMRIGRGIDVIDIRNAVGHQKTSIIVSSSEFFRSFI